MNVLTKYLIIISLALVLLPNLSYGAKNKKFYGNYEVTGSTGACPSETYYLTIGGDASRISEDRYLYIKSKGKSFIQNNATSNIIGMTITYSWSDPGDAGSVTYTFSKGYKNGTVSGEITEGTCTGAITGTFSREIIINWEESLHYAVGRSWQYIEPDQDTYSEYIKEITDKGGLSNVYVLGWSSNYSDWLDYRIFKDDGVYFVGYYDDEDKMNDVIFPSPFSILRSSIELGKTYIDKVKISSNKTIKMKTKHEVVGEITVPYATYDDVIKVTWTVVKGEHKIFWYAKNIGMIKECNIIKNKCAELINITEPSDPPVRPVD